MLLISLDQWDMTHVDQVRIYLLPCTDPHDHNPQPGPTRRSVSQKHATRGNDSICSVVLVQAVWSRELPAVVSVQVNPGGTYSFDVGPRYPTVQVGVCPE